MGHETYELQVGESAYNDVTHQCTKRRPVQDLYCALHTYSKLVKKLITDIFLFQMPGSDVAAGQVSMLLYCVSC